LQYLKFRKKIKAEDGEKGSIKKCHGRAGDDIYLKVPLGTILIDEETNEVIADITQDKEQFVICNGGMGGNGNANFKSNFNSAPSLYELGDFGEQKTILLELKIIADIGIVGLPNAGKSTFISMISNAKPKIANYQFTTLSPSLGTIYKNNQRVIFADIPGLIKGASDGIGLGHDFLKHIERTKVLIHIVSMDNFDNEDVINSYKIIKEELKKYSEILDKKPMIIVANKMDTPSADKNYSIFSNFLKGEKIIKISAINSENLSQVVDLAFKLLEDIRKKENAQIIEVKYINELKSKDKNLDKTMLLKSIGENS
jgi:GTP-binding protein